MENLLIALVGAFFSAACGGYIGHKLTVKLFEDRSKQQKKAFFGEFSIIRDSYSAHISLLINDYQNPLKDSYSGIPKFDMTIIDSLSVELCSSPKILSIEQRKLIIRLKAVLLKIQDIGNKRSELILDWHQNEDKGNTYHPMQFYTAQLLLDFIQITFYTCKLVEEKDNFTFGEYCAEEHAEVACSICKIEFDKSFWTKVKNRLA